MFSKIYYYLFKSYHRPSSKILHVFIFFKKFFYNKKTKLFSEKMFLLKDPPNSIIYLNFFGRMFIMALNFLYIIFLNKFSNKKIFIDDGTKNPELLASNKGDSNTVWPHQSITFNEKYNSELENEFYDSLEKNYKFCLDLISNNSFFKDSPWWTSIREEYQNAFFDQNKRLDLSALSNFRSNVKTKSAIIADQSYLKNDNKYNKLKSLGLINLYHKISEYLDLEILRKVSESYVGKNICLNYRGQRLSHDLLRHAYFCSQILKFTELDRNKKNIIVDIGGGYGGLTRLLKYFFKNSTIVMFEIPETCILASYFLKKNFPNLKIGQALNFKDLDIIKEQNLKDFDFVILPQPFIEKIEKGIIDLTINTISMGEMTNETQNYYVSNIEKITKDYFYSVNRPAKRTEKYNAQGFYEWKFQNQWDTKLYNFSYTYHIEFLGKKQS